MFDLDKLLELAIAFTSAELDPMDLKAELVSWALEPTTQADSCRLPVIWTGRP